MKKQLHISIPKPCHKDWQKMTPNQQGKFCNACAKTVVDFTKKSVKEIQSFFIENQGKKVCGRFQQTQLDSITIEIPEQILFQQKSISRIFLLALVITMGATLMSCNFNGKKQKINQVIVLDSLSKTEKKIDSISKDSVVKSTKPIKPEKIIPPEIIVIPPSKGDVVLGLPIAEPEEFEKNDTIKTFEEPILFGMIQESPPTFKGSNAKTDSEKREEFREKINAYVKSKFDTSTTENLDLKEGKHKIIATFTIDKKGEVTDLKVLAPHPILKNEIEKIINELPLFEPATQRNKPISIKYTLPITFLIE